MRAGEIGPDIHNSLTEWFSEAEATAERWIGASKTSEVLAIGAGAIVGSKCQRQGGKTIVSSRSNGAGAAVGFVAHI